MLSEGGGRCVGGDRQAEMTDGGRGTDGAVDDPGDEAALRAALARARSDAAAAHDRLSFLVDVSRTVAATTDHASVLQAVLDLAVPRIADAGLALLPRGGGLERVAVAHRDPEAAALGRKYVLGTVQSLDSEGVGPVAFRTGRLQISTASQIQSDARLPDYLRQTIEVFGLRSWVSVPIQAGGETLGVLSLGFNDPQAVESDDGIAMAVELAGRSASALVGGMLLEHEREVALALQSSVLPASLPEVPGYEIAARYVPAQSNVRVGGDWYDALVLPDRKVAITIGDVSGHGVAAASTMGQVRNALRAYAVEGHGPARVIRLLSTLLESTVDEQYASMIDLRVEPDTGTFGWVSAGHPPLLHLHDGTVDELAEPHGILLGADSSVASPEGAGRLAPGDALVLYTDGLVERRGVGIDEGIAALERSLLAVDDPSADALCAAAFDRPDEGYEDDVCVLVIRRVPPAP